MSETITLQPNLQGTDAFAKAQQELQPQLYVPEQFQGIIEKLPSEAERQNFVDGIVGLPLAVQESYFKRMGHTLNEKDEVTALSGRRGILFELRRIANVQQGGLEAIDFATADKIGEVTYLGYSKKADINGEPDVQLTSSVDCDVPLSRDGQPYVYEVKNYARMAYGSKPNSKNQVLKYEQAVESGKAAGASVELKGRIDPQFIEWVKGNEEQPSPVPNVELLYTLDLPSGQEYTVILKPGPEGKGLNFANPELRDDLDRQVVEGIQAAQADGTLGSIIAVDHAEVAPDEMKPFMADALSIKSTEVFDEYEGIRRAAIYDQLIAKVSRQVSPAIAA